MTCVLPQHPFFAFVLVALGSTALALTCLALFARRLNEGRMLAGMGWLLGLCASSWYAFLVADNTIQFARALLAHYPACS